MSNWESWESLISLILASRENSNSSSQNRKLIAAIRKGISPYTESYAFPYVLPYCDDAVRDQTAVLRAAALTAMFPEIPQTNKENPLRVGQSFALASRKLSELGGDYSANDPAKPDAIASRLRVIQFLDIEQAVLVIRGLLSLCKKTEIPLNYYALARILVHWGNGVTPQSKKVRQAMVRDYYGYVPARG